MPLLETSGPLSDAEITAVRGVIDGEVTSTQLFFKCACCNEAFAGVELQQSDDGGLQVSLYLEEPSDDCEKWMNDPCTSETAAYDVTFELGLPYTDTDTDERESVRAIFENIPEDNEEFRLPISCETTPNATLDPSEYSLSISLRTNGFKYTMQSKPVDTGHTAASLKLLSGRDLPASMLTPVRLESMPEVRTQNGKYRRTRKAGGTVGILGMLTGGSKYFSDLLDGAFLESGRSVALVAASAAADDDEGDAASLDVEEEPLHGELDPSADLFIDSDDDYDVVPEDEEMQGEEAGSTRDIGLRTQALRHGGSQGPDRMRSIRISGCSATTLAAVVCYIQTGIVNFAPLTTRFLLSPDVDDTTDLAMRHLPDMVEAHKDSRARVQKFTEQHKLDMVPASPKSVFVLADKLGLEELKNIAKTAYRENLVPEIAFMEMISYTVLRHRELQEVVEEYILENWQDVRDSDALKDATLLAKCQAVAPQVLGFLRILAKVEGTKTKG